MAAAAGGAPAGVVAAEAGALAGSLKAPVLALGALPSVPGSLKAGALPPGVGSLKAPVAGGVAPVPLAAEVGGAVPALAPAPALGLGRLKAGLDAPDAVAPVPFAAGSLKGVEPAPDADGDAPLLPAPSGVAGDLGGGVCALGSANGSTIKLVTLGARRSASRLSLSSSASR